MKGIETFGRKAACEGRGAREWTRHGPLRPVLGQLLACWGPALGSCSRAAGQSSGWVTPAEMVCVVGGHGAQAPTKGVQAPFWLDTLPGPVPGPAVPDLPLPCLPASHSWLMLFPCLDVVAFAPGDP